MTKLQSVLLVAFMAPDGFFCLWKICEMLESRCQSDLQETSCSGEGIFEGNICSSYWMEGAGGCVEGMALKGWRQWL